MAKNILLVGFSVAPPEWRAKLIDIQICLYDLPGVEVRKGSAPKDWAWATVRWAPGSPAPNRYTAHLPQDLPKVRELYRRLKGQQAPTLVDVKFPDDCEEPVRANCPKCAGVGKFAWISSYTKELVKGKCYACKGTGKVVN